MDGTRIVLAKGYGRDGHKYDGNRYLSLYQYIAVGDGELGNVHMITSASLMGDHIGWTDRGGGEVCFKI